jgi:hypothetical protein
VVPGLDTAYGATYAAAPVAGPITFVQMNYATPQTNQNSVSVRYNAAQSAAGLNVVIIGWNDVTSSVSSVTDSAGNVYQVAAPVARGGGVSQTIYYAKGIAASLSNTVTVVFNASAAFVDIRVLEYSGVETVAPLDKSASAVGTATTASTGSVTTTAAKELIVGAGTTTGGFTSAGTGFTSRIITSPDADIAEDRLVSATGTYSATAAQNGAWVMQIVTFKGAAQ